MAYLHRPSLESTFRGLQDTIVKLEVSNYYTSLLPHFTNTFCYQILHTCCLLCPGFLIQINGDNVWIWTGDCDRIYFSAGFPVQIFAGFWIDSDGSAFCVQKMGAHFSNWTGHDGGDCLQSLFEVALLHLFLLVTGRFLHCCISWFSSCVLLKESK